MQNGTATSENSLSAYNLKRVCTIQSSHFIPTHFYPQEIESIHPNKDWHVNAHGSFILNFHQWKNKTVHPNQRILGFLGGTSGKEPICQCRSKRVRSDPWVRKIPQRRAWQPTPVFLAEESHGQRSLASSSPQDRKESDMTEVTQNTLTHKRTLLSNKKKQIIDKHVVESKLLC